MSTQVFINLPVKDLPRSMEFFKQLGYSFNQQFTNDMAACLVISDTIYSMLITEPMFKGFTPKQICNAAESSEVLIALSCESREGVDEMLRKVLAAGGKEVKEPTDHGFMYYRIFEDLDGHIWESFYMDPNHVR